MRNSIDVGMHVSPELWEIAGIVIQDPDREKEPRLEDVKSFLEDDKSIEALLSETTRPLDRETLLDEVDSLIEEFGGDALAIEFVTVKASVELSRVIEEAVVGAEVPEVPTLGAVREAMSAGLVARLVGDGLIESDATTTLLTEIDSLIELYGEDAVALDFVRFE